MSKMFDLDDVLAIEGGAETEEAHFLAIQRAINAGSWSLQGSFGRTMMAAITAGCCMLGERDARDYWGNHIPSRTQVQEGTKGSFDYVAEHRGADWAEMMANA